MDWFFGSWENLARTFVSGIILFVTVAGMVRMLGPRTASKMNNFDWIVTVAMGSIVASATVLKSVPILEGLVGVVALAGMQYAMTKSSIRSLWFQKVIHADEILLLHNGQFLDDNLQKARVTQNEVLAAMRTSGYCSLQEMYAVVLESSGEIGLVPRESCEDKQSCECLDDFDLDFTDILHPTEDT